MSDCNVERTYVVTHSTINMATGEMKEGHKETKTGPCGTPLFGELHRKLGVCGSCLKGWEVIDNRPTEKGRAQIDAARSNSER